MYLFKKKFICSKIYLLKNFICYLLLLREVAK